jgi:arsenate reductase
VAALTIYHNPKCSKSREALGLLESRGLKPRIVKYLETPPSAGELAAIVARLGISPEALVRKGESVYRSEYAGRKLSDAEWIAAMVEHPILIERPILVAGERAVIGRPPDRVLTLLPESP